MWKAVVIRDSETAQYRWEGAVELHNVGAGKIKDEIVWTSNKLHDGTDFVDGKLFGKDDSDHRYLELDSICRPLNRGSGPEVYKTSYGGTLEKGQLTLWWSRNTSPSRRVTVSGELLESFCQCCET
jgi:hypothetical protein